MQGRAQVACGSRSLKSPPVRVTVADGSALTGSMDGLTADLKAGSAKRPERYGVAP